MLSMCCYPTQKWNILQYMEKYVVEINVILKNVVYQIYLTKHIFLI